MGRPKLVHNKLLWCRNGCLRGVLCRGVCRRCYRKINYDEYERARRGATKTEELPIGSRYVDSNGYILIKIDNKKGRSHSDNWVKEHRLVMSQMIGRPLKRYENVHHKNGMRIDNRPRNLELWVKKQPPGQRARDLVKFAKWILGQYGELEYV